MQGDEIGLGRHPYQGWIRQDKVSYHGLQLWSAVLIANPYRTLDKLNRTPFFMPVGPNKKARNKEVEATMLRGKEEKERREETRRDGFGINLRMEETTRDLVRGANGPKQIGSGKKAAPNKKFVFVDDNGEFDQEDADDEELIAQGLEATFQKTQMLNKVSNLMGEDIERSNARLDRIGSKVSLMVLPFFSFSLVANQ